ncbi:MAG: SUMF1/EgtB/PvdO family nonheme iron enzyme [Herpetosiphonaceae bacterium]|nr:SUMF1/EgtB/PvdO family nonheme iron enzyme [Herpetosiphonaceae bacterium]
MQCPRCATNVKDGAKFCPACGAGIPSWTGRLVKDDVLISRYRVIRPLARGGMGAVYLATDNRLGDAPVALKEMMLSHAPGDTKAWEQAISDFHREAALLARLSHPNLPRVIDQFQIDDNQFLAMEYVEGRTLRAEMESRTEPIPLELALSWFHQLASVLGYLHAQDPPIIYRDLKPTNVMIRTDERIALIDFGIARLYKPGQAGDTAIYGTPGYAPPEQYGIGQTDARSDVYSLAMVFHEMLTRFDPVRRTSNRPPLANTLRPDVPFHVAQAIHRALANEADERFQTIKQFVAAVDQPATVATVDTVMIAQPKSQVYAETAATSLIDSQAPPRPRPGRRGLVLGGIGIAGLLLALGLMFVLRNQNTADPAATMISQSVPSASPADATATTVAKVATPTPPLATPTLGPAPPGMVGIIAGTYTLGSDAGPPDEQPIHSISVNTFYLDRTEVTVGDYRRCVEDGQCTPPTDRSSLTHPDYFDNPEFAAYPVINVTWDQARTYCQAQGRRLPTELEWESAARGTEGRVYPWGDEWDPSRLNIWGSGQDGDVLAPGAFPAGATPEGLLDLAGNVAEWTSTLDQTYPYSANDGRELANQYGPRIVRGSFNGSNAINARAAARNRRQPNEFANNLGFRCVTNSFYVPAGMDYIPGGTWTLGVSEEDSRAIAATYEFSDTVNYQPANVITTTEFYLDHTEVTNAAYAAFVSATNHPLPRNSFDPVGLAVWNDDGTIPVTRTDHPVVNVTWADATAYCTWAGKRLPTEAEWERAARGDGGRLWPWGREWDTAKANTKESLLQTTTAAGTYPAGAGPYGTLDLAGNVWEWTNSLNRPYPYRADDGRESATDGGGRVLRGGSWFDEQPASLSSLRNSLLPNLANTNVGFRCAQDLP